MKFNILATACSFLLVGFVLIAPETVSAQAGGLVPCGGSGQDPCNACHVAQLAETVIAFIIQISFVVAALLFAYAGFLFFTGGSNPGKITTGRTIVTNTFVGIIIILTSWLLVNVILTTLTGQGVNPFTKVLCEVNVENFKAPQSSSSSSGRDNDSSSGLKAGGVSSQEVQSSTGPFSIFSPEDIQIKANSVDDYASVSCVYTQQAGLSSDNCSATLAITALESSGNANAQNEDSYGLMQLKASTAKGLDPTLAALSDTEVEEILLNNTDKNIELGTKYYAQLYEEYQDHDLASAGYNGGPSANDSSKNCPGLRRWECVWDSSGCYKTNNTNCKINYGYQETRAYVINAAAMRTEISGQ